MTMLKTKKILLALLTCTLAITNVARATNYDERVVNTETGVSYTGSTFEECYGIYGPGDDYDEQKGAYNFVTENGGALCNTGTISEISGTTFTENKAGTEIYEDPPEEQQVLTKFGGGAIYNDTIGTISKISGSTFSGNYIDLTNYYAQEYYLNLFGGAIWNDGTIGEITDTGFSENKIELDAQSMISSNKIMVAVNNGGGALYNTGTIASITASEDNYTTDSTTGALTESSSTFSDNSVTGTGLDNLQSQEASLGGGAIWNTGTIGTDSAGTITGGISYTVFSGNSVELARSSGTETGGDYEAKGGAIWNDSSGKISEISNSLFTGNTTTVDGYTTTAYGGAICNEGTISSIANTTFTSNKSITKTVAKDSHYDSHAYGGAIYNSGTITAITGSTFTLNEAVPNGEGSYYSGAYGGAIYNDKGTIGTISDCTFTSNTADRGGAIENENGTIETISGCTFTGNQATNGSGGAIYNSGTMTLENCTFSGNTASSNGGAIYNSGTITLENCTFSDNTATTSGETIYNSGTANINYSGQDVEISGNSANGSANFLYGTKSSVTNFNLSEGASLTIEDGITGADGYKVNIAGDNSDTTFYLLADIGNAALSVGDSYGKLTLNTIDSTAKTYSLNSFTVAGNFNMAVDVDLENETMDRISATEYGESSGTLTVSSMNIFSDTDKDCVAIYFADPDLMKSVEQASGLTVTAYSPIYKYSYNSNDVHYVYSEDGNIYYNGSSVGTTDDTELIEDDGGYFVFGATETSGAGSDSQHHLGDYNPAVLASEVATAGVYRAMNMVLDYGFEHSDYFMKLPESVRLAQIDQAKTNQSASKVKENDPTKLTYYNQHELTYRGAWAKSFYSNDRVSFQDGFTSRDKYYGAMLGFDSNLKEHGDGWAHLFTGYVGTMGIRQDWGGGHIKQHGGFVGATASFYKKNFFTAWTIAAGMMKAHEHTMYGKDKERLDSYGVAGRFGWNIDMDYNGKFAILPTFTASYSTVNPENFTNSADVKFTGSGFRAVQLNPNVKFIWKMNDGWQPYLTVGEVWTVGESSHVTATYSGTRNNLTALDLRAYTEYGAGVQKRWANDRDAYIEFLGHSDGRDGFLVNAGIRWNF